jgi:hypothetical protein
MHCTFQRDLATARIADLHHQAAHERVARAAVRARRAHPGHRTRAAPGRAVTRLARWALTLVGGRSPSPTR